MFSKIMIALVAFLVCASVAAAQEWQPSWAPQPIQLIQGTEYRTGSPLSKPGGLGLLGGIANGISGGEMPSWAGGGTLIWEGENVACDGVIINSICMPVFTHAAEARAAQESIDWSTVENKPRTGDGERADCGYSFAEAVEMDTAYDWCSGEQIDYARLPSCPDNQALFATIVKDTELGARTVYSCQEVSQ